MDWINGMSEKLTNKMDLTVGTLCSGGVDGMAEGARREGFKIVYNMEIDPFLRKLLKQEYPETKQYHNVYEDKPKEWTNVVAITSECQNISIAAGNRATGIWGNASRTLFACVGIAVHLRPDFILFENSDQLRKKGLEFLLYELSKNGYHVEWQCLSLRTFGVQQSRKRIYIIAYSDKIKLQQRGIKETIFSKPILQREFRRVSPGWKTRRDLPERRTIRTTHGFAHWKNRTQAIGNMIHPRAAQFLFKCVKNYYQRNGIK